MAGHDAVEPVVTANDEVEVEDSLAAEDEVGAALAAAEGKGKPCSRCRRS